MEPDTTEAELKWGRPIRALADRKRSLDILTFLVLAPLIGGYAWDIYHGSRAELPDWIKPYLIPWGIVFAAVQLARYLGLKCPRCRASVRAGADKLFLTPLPAACRSCGLVLRAGSAGRPVGSQASVPERAAIRTGVIWGSGVVLALGVSGLAYNPARPGMSFAFGIGLAAFFSGFMLFVRKTQMALPRCPKCGRAGESGSYCGGCGGSLSK